jgi:SAM-dependent methyltransferase
MTEKLLVPVYLPDWLHRSVVKMKRAVMPRHAPIQVGRIDLSGDREIEWSFIASRIPAGTGEVLDFGCGYGTLTIHAAQRGYRVIALDLESHVFSWIHPEVQAICGDLLKLDLPSKHFDLILNCSSIEHVGLAGRYGNTIDEANDDLVAMRKLNTLLKDSGKMLLTIPCGRDAVIVPWHRVYGAQRLPRLLEGYRVEEECYWTKGPDNRWRQSTKEIALSFEPSSSPIPAQCSYAIGCFVLRTTDAE